MATTIATWFSPLAAHHNFLCSPLWRPDPRPAMPAFPNPFNLLPRPTWLARCNAALRLARSAYVSPFDHLVLISAAFVVVLLVSHGIIELISEFSPGFAAWMDTNVAIATIWVPYYGPSDESLQVALPVYVCIHSIR